MVQLKSVSKWYHGHSHAHSRVLDNVDLELKKGDFIYVVGGSGAGKSSLLRLLATEELPSSGQISLFGYNMMSVSDSTLRAIRRCLGYVPQNTRLIPDLTVYDNVALSLSLAGRASVGAQARSRIGEALERLGLGHKKDTFAQTLSGGEAQRVAFARALVRQPELIVADEPTGAQDNEFTWSMMDLFVKANLGGATVVIATHDREIVRRLRRRCAVLKHGRLQMEASGNAACIY